MAGRCGAGRSSGPGPAGRHKAAGPLTLESLGSHKRPSPRRGAAAGPPLARASADAATDVAAGEAAAAVRLKELRAGGGVGRRRGVRTSAFAPFHFLCHVLPGPRVQGVQARARRAGSSRRESWRAGLPECGNGPRRGLNAGDESTFMARKPFGSI